MSEKKYWVPAIERANIILNLIASRPAHYRLIGLSHNSGINKSSLYSLLQTLESLEWVVKEEDDTYSIGHTLGILASPYYSNLNVIKVFHKEAKVSVKKLDETIQLGKLEGVYNVYLAREMNSSLVQMVTAPGSRLPAYATGLGKTQLLNHNFDELAHLFKDVTFEKLSKYTLENVDQLWRDIQTGKSKGVMLDKGEAVAGFHCVAAPIYDFNNRIIAAVSVTMLESKWEEKQFVAEEEILDLANRISAYFGYKEGVM
ncbi:IclR family transcriptional regulator [Cytobacillus depressus]|uniref:IclR family transcriptional regulator n=1 Tax=Cytobacillus depressus TaxID=1602942 RepID=A0A6L3UZ24_9BACI|nr:IclR family transcriptional regulator [Cytobacillus depressus]KAB2329544.1 IclR family transcriptional regulator [Cytobacillus depressus]